MIGVTHVERAPSSGASAPSYDRESGILEVPIIEGEQWTNGFDLDALVVVDVTDDLAVANLDILVPRDDWVRGLPLTRLERRSGLRRLRVTPEVLATKSFTATPEVFVSEDGTRVQVLLPGKRQAVRGIPISKHCDSLVVGDELVGFQIKIPPSDL